MVNEDQSVSKMEFRRFVHAILLLPAQIVRTGRRVIYRIMGYNPWVKDLFAAWGHLRRLCAHLAKQNDPDPHHNSCQHEANSAPIPPQAAFGVRCPAPKLELVSLILIGCVLR